MALFRPPALALVTVLARVGARPEAVVVTHFAIGLAAAALILQGERGAWLLAAVLLQVKTVLDNADGTLARRTGQVTELGRYLDTVLDFVVNVTLFLALGAHGPWLLALLALVVLTLLLSWDFNAERLYRQARVADHGSVAADSGRVTGRPQPLLRVFGGCYQALFAPQDRLVEAVDSRLFRLAGGADYAPGSSQRLAWSDRLSTAALVDLGLSTQLLLLGVCLAFGRPFTYIHLVLIQALYLVAVQTVRVTRFRRALLAGNRT